jgi:hypothetical protein
MNFNDVADNDLIVKGTIVVVMLNLRTGVDYLDAS